MTSEKIVKLLLKSSESNPYTGMLSKENNIIAAIDLGELFKQFAERGQTNEAMNIEVSQWDEAISHLKLLL